MQRHPRPSASSYAGARPAGESDDTDDDDDYCISSFTSKKKTIYPTIPTTSTNGNANGHADDDWGDGFYQSASTVTATQKTEEYWGESPQEIIQYACIRGNLEKLKEQLSAVENSKCNINEFYKHNVDENPLITASLHANYDIVEYLLTEKKADPNKKPPHAKTTAILALAGCSDKEEEVLIKCAVALVKAGAIVDIPDRFGLTALMISVKRNRPQLAKYLLENGADPNLTEPENCRTAIFFAAVNGDGRTCRLLIEHGADVSIEDRFGWSVPDLAQDKNYPELSNLLFIVRDTKWKPGLHPKLMKEFDEIAVAERNARRDSQLLQEESSIQMFLQAVDGEKYLNNFRKHKISYLQFLNLNEDNLKEIGVEEIGIREQLLDNIKRINNAQWQQASIKNIATNKNVTAAEAVCMVVNIKEHLEHISSSLAYTNKRIQQNPLALQYDLERNRLEDLMKFLEQTEVRSRQVRQNIVELHKTIGGLQGYTELQIVGRIPKRSFNKPKKPGRKSTFRWELGVKIVTGMGLISGCLFIGLKYIQRPSLLI